MVDMLIVKDLVTLSIIPVVGPTPMTRIPHIAGHGRWQASPPSLERTTPQTLQKVEITSVQLCQYIVELDILNLRP